MRPIRTDEITGLWTFLTSIDWTEPWFLLLGLFHVLCMAASFLTRNNMTAQGVVFACLLVMVGCSEYINEFAAEHARMFARQQYFDSNGLFISVVFSMPILFNCLVIVVIWLKTSANLMAGIRRKQLRHQHAQAEAKNKEEQTTADADSQKPAVKHDKQE